MAWELDADRPIYAQLVERIQKEIVSGKYQPGEKLPSVRDLAAVAAVNPNTMQKAFAELERSGLIVTQRTSGRAVTEDTELIGNNSWQPGMSGILSTTCRNWDIRERRSGISSIRYRPDRGANL